jgi:uncharacterized RDD family membrane protein YckC
LIPFPVSPQRVKSSEAAKEAGAETAPSWRKRLDETIREIRERRTAESDQRQTLARPLTPNPLVEAAVNRIRRAEMPSNSAFSHTLGPMGQGAQAVARAIKCEDEPESAVESHAVTLPHGAKSVPAMMATAPVKSNKQAPGVPQTRVVNQPISPVSPASPGSLASSVTTPTPGKQPAQATATHRAHAVEAVAPDSEDYSASPGAPPLLARAAANVIDVGLIVLSYLPFLTAFTLFEAEFSRWSLYALAVIAIAAIFCYHLLTVAIAGRTSGLALCKLRLVDTASERVPPTLGQAGRRAFGATLSLLLLPLNLLVILLSLDHLSLSDYLSGTTIVRQ